MFLLGDYLCPSRMYNSVKENKCLLTKRSIRRNITYEVYCAKCRVGDFMHRKINEQYVFGKLFKLVNEIQTTGNHTIREVTIRQWFLLVMLKNLGNEASSVTDLADFTGSTRQSVIQTIDTLQKKGFIETSVLEEDKRAKKVRLTQKAFDLFQTQERVGNVYLDRLFEGLSAREVEELNRMLDLVLANTEKMMRSKRENEK